MRQVKVSSRAHRVCPECGESFKAHHGRQVFCEPAHQSAFHDRNRYRGKILLPLAQAWRRRRKDDKSGVGKYAFGEVCALLDLWSAQDRDAGRRPELIAEDRMANQWSAADVGFESSRARAAIGLPS